MSLQPLAGTTLHRLIVALAETLAEKEGTPFLKFTVTCGTGQEYVLIVEKRQKFPKEAA